MAGILPDLFPTDPVEPMDLEEIKRTAGPLHGKLVEKGDGMDCANCGNRIRKLGSVDYKGEPIWSHDGTIHGTQCQMFARPKVEEEPDGSPDS